MATNNFKKFSVSLTNTEGKEVYFTFSTKLEAINFAQQVRTSEETVVRTWQWNPDTKKSELIDCNDQPDLTITVHWKAPDGKEGSREVETVAIAEYTANRAIANGYKAYYTVGTATFVPKAPQVPEVPEITFCFKKNGEDTKQITVRMTVDAAMKKLESAKASGIMAAFKHPETGMWVVLSSDPAPAAPVAPVAVPATPSAPVLASASAAAPALAPAVPSEVHIWTDGSCSGNPGPGGWSAVLICGKHQKEISGGVSNTTNNRMELMAIIEGLKALKFKAEVTIYSDSAYVVNPIDKGWLKKWCKNGWLKSDKKPVENRDLWEEFINLSKEKCIHLHMEKVKGHSGDPMNDRCDTLAKAAAASV